MARDVLWTERVRTLRTAYDNLRPGDRAEIVRPRDAERLRTEGAAWWLMTRALPQVDNDSLGMLIPVLYLFAFARPVLTPTPDEPFYFGAWMRRALEPTLRDSLMRKVARAGDVRDLTHHMARVLRAAHGAVEWGAFGADLVFWTMGGDARQRVLAGWMSRYYGSPRT